MSPRSKDCVLAVSEYGDAELLLIRHEIEDREELVSNVDGKYKVESRENRKQLRIPRRNSASDSLA
jgi:hypothetical protein